MARSSKKTPEVNASSQADIAFLLLIFFLVATTMNTDAGINRTLPPWVEDTSKLDNQIKERNLMEVKIDQSDRIMAAGQIVRLTEIKDIAKDFYLNRNDDENLPEKEMTQIDIIGMYPVSQGVISLQNDRGTSYDMYLKVQNELTRAVNEIRDEIAQEKFGARYKDLSEPQREAINKAQKMPISEAEPKTIGGN